MNNNWEVFVRTLFVSFILLTIPIEAKEWKGGELQSNQEFTYGQFSARIYCTMNSGVLSTFFLFNNDGVTDLSKWNEIGLEVLGQNYALNWQSNVIWQYGPVGALNFAEEVHTAPFSFAEGWHTFTIEWTPNGILWFVDGTFVRWYGANALPHLSGPMKIMFNLWAHESIDWVGPFETQSLPAYHYIDWVAYHPINPDGNGFTVKPTFFDDFTSLDNWERSTHTWDGNRVDFDASNASILDDDFAVLSLTHDSATGAPNYAPNKLIPTIPYHIKSLNTDSCLTIPPEYFKGSPVKLLPCDQSKLQQWLFDYRNNGFHSITNSASKMALHIRDGSTNHGTVIEQWDDVDDNQLFRVIWFENTEYYQIHPKKGVETGEWPVIEETSGELALAQNQGRDSQVFTLTPAISKEDEPLPITFVSPPAKLDSMIEHYTLEQISSAMNGFLSNSSVTHTSDTHISTDTITESSGSYSPPYSSKITLSSAVIAPLFEKISEKVTVSTPNRQFSIVISYPQKYATQGNALQLTLFTITGSVLYRSEYTHGTSIQVPYLSPGIYGVQLKERINSVGTSSNPSLFIVP
ncbi:MAG: family 16 glycosylhydrolase [Fibrobacterales bacterium]